MHEPLVSVVVPVWNVEQQLEQCLDSVLEQTMAPESIEIIAVDDGSSDSSGEILDRYAATESRVTVVHQPNSGGPGRPRNVGLDRARGRYVFFLDADDYLGPDALARLTTMAEQNDSDVVLAKMVGVGGRPVPQAAFRRNRERATIAQVYSSLSVLKLFRRSLIERLGLRFAEGLQGGEDAPFTISAYLAADVISVVADYDCYYARFRVGSQSASGWKWGPELVGHLSRMGARMALVGAALPDGDERDALLARHVADLVRPFKPQWRRMPEDLRHDAFVEAAGHARRWCSVDVVRRLPAWNAIRGWCLLHSLETELIDIAEYRPQAAAERAVIEDARVYLGYPHFRDASRIPDWCFEVTDRISPVIADLRVNSAANLVGISGIAYLPLFGGCTRVVLRTDSPYGAVVLPTQAVPTPDLRDRRADYPSAGFTFEIEPARMAQQHGLGRGPLQVLLRVGSDRLWRDVALRADQAVLQPDGPLRRSSVDGALEFHAPGWWQRATRKIRPGR